MEASAQQQSSGVARPLRILSWNVNGLSAVLKRLYGPAGTISRFLEDVGANADIICLQETKLRKTELASAAHMLAAADGWDSFFSCSNSPRGYSGTATFCRTGVCLPFAAESGFSGLADGGLSAHTDLTAGGAFSIEELRNLDSEGRVVVTDHGAFVLYNVYGPAITSEDPEQAKVRVAFKMRFYAALQRRWESLLAAGRGVIVVGDLNISPAPIDYPDYDPEFYRASRPDRLWLRTLLGQDPSVPSLSSFGSTTVFDHSTNQSYLNHDERGDLLSSEQKEMIMARESHSSHTGSHMQYRTDTMTDSTNRNSTTNTNTAFIDCFRVFHPERKKAFTVWSTSTGARANNYGSRIDLTLAAGLPIRSKKIPKDIITSTTPTLPYMPSGQEPKAGTHGDLGIPIDPAVSSANDKIKVVIVGADIEPHVMGSDHCPVWVDIGLASSLSYFPCATTAPACAMRFTGKQTKLHGWLTRGKNPSSGEILEDSGVAVTREEAPEQQKVELAAKRAINSGDGSQQRTEILPKPSGSVYASGTGTTGGGSKQVSLKAFFISGGKSNISAGGAGAGDERIEQKHQQQQQQGQQKEVDRIENPHAEAVSFNTAHPLAPKALPSGPLPPGPSSEFIQAELAAAAEAKKTQLSAARGAWQAIQQRMQVPRCLHGDDAAMKKVNKSGPNHGE